MPHLNTQLQMRYVMSQPTLRYDDRTALSRPARIQIFPTQSASSPTQLSRVATSLRKPDHAAPNGAAL